MRSSLLFFGLFSMLLFSAAREAIGRTWTDKSGRFTSEAELVRVQGDNVVLKKQNGRTITIPLNKLSQADRNFLSSLNKKTVAKTPTGRNKLIGTWVLEAIEIDEAKFKRLREKEGMPANLVEQAIKDVAQMKLTYVFNADGTTWTIVETKPDLPAEEEEGKWEFIEAVGNTIKIKNPNITSEDPVSTLKFEGNDKYTLTSTVLEQAAVKQFVLIRSKTTLQAAAHEGISKALATWIALIEAKKQSEFMKLVIPPGQATKIKEMGMWEELVKHSTQDAKKTLMLFKAIQKTKPRISPGGTIATYKAPAELAKEDPTGKGEMSFVKIGGQWRLKREMVKRVVEEEEEVELEEPG